MQALTKKYKPRIGEMLLGYDLITNEQLAKALDRQIQTGSRLGSILEEMGYVDGDLLLSVLGSQHNLPSANLFEARIPPDVLRLVPFEQVRSFKILPLNKSGNTLSLAMVDPGDANVIRSIELATGGAVKPYLAPSSQMAKVIDKFEKEGYGDVPFEGEKLRGDEIRVESLLPGFYTLLRFLPDFQAAELHLAAGAAPGLKINNELKRLSMPRVTPAQMKNFIYEILERERIEEFERSNELNVILSLPDIGRFRISIYKQRSSISLTARLILENIPSINYLRLPDWMTDYAMKPQGLMLIAGLPGNGKTATLAALVDVINSNRRCNIVTLEDHVEYLHKHKLSNVNQREVGMDTDSFSSGLRHIVRQGADVVVIGELRDAESSSIALNAAETGRLVIAAVTALNTVSAVNKIINIFHQDQQPRIRMQLADNLLLVFAQRLIPGKEDGGKVLAYEKLLNSSRVRNMIIEARTVNMQSLMQVAAEDMASFDRSIAGLCLDGRITFEEGLKSADTPSFYQDLIRTGRAY